MPYSVFATVDLFSRLAAQSGIRPTIVFGITDVDDKIIERAKQINKPLRHVSTYFSKCFLEDLRSLNIRFPKFFSRVTDNTEAIIGDIRHLQDKGLTQVDQEGTVRFNLQKYCKDHSYGVFQKGTGKDFALWRPRSAEYSIDSPWGAGIPGWHIECFSMGTISSYDI